MMKPLLLMMLALAATLAWSAAAPSAPARAADLVPPIRAAFYYPWFSPAWTQQGVYPYTNYHPSLGFYDERDQATIQQHIAAMQYGNIAAGIASWWGQGTYTDARVADLLTASAGTTFQWTLYYEPEGQGDPSVAQITADLTYIRDHYASDPHFLHIGGRFVIFVYANADSCPMADRWKQANTVNAYVVLKVFSGYRTCASQPDGWHQYGPAVAASPQTPYAYTISPGFYKVGEQPRLTRDLARWNQNIRDMIASGTRFQLVTTFNEWGEGTAVESASEWPSPSGYGAYLDALHSNGSPSASQPCGVSSSPPTTYQHVIWIWMENRRYGDVIGDADAPYQTQLAQQCASAANYSIVGNPSLPNYIGATAGSTFGIADDNPPSAHVLTGDNLFRQVRAAGMTEKSYQESMTENCALSSGGLYAVKHNPAAYYAGGSDRTACLTNDVPMGTTTSGAFITDLNNNTLPNFSFITPNLCNDTHDCSVATGDAWLQSWVPLILNSAAYSSGSTALVITYDEPSPMPNVILSPSVRPGTVASTGVDHYSLLRTTEELLGITNYLGLASTALSMRELFEGGSEISTPDTDGDGCPDMRELGASHATGGQRDPNNGDDFFDVPVPVLTPLNTAGVRNQAVTIADVLATLTYIGTTDGGGANGFGLSYNSDLNGNGVPDGREYDRTPSLDASMPWRSSAPNGLVSIQDALVALAQVGDNCS